MKVLVSVIAIILLAFVGCDRERINNSVDVSTGDGQSNDGGCIRQCRFIEVSAAENDPVVIDEICNGETVSTTEVPENLATELCDS
jgi:hypothetical protein